MALNTTPTDFGNLGAITWVNTDGFLVKAFNAATSTRVQAGLNTIAANADGSAISPALTFTSAATDTVPERLALAVAFSAHLKKKK